MQPLDAKTFDFWKFRSEMASRNPDSGNIPFSGLDFQASDDAWYGVQLVLRDETLTVKYCNFSDAFDERFSAGNFKSLKEVEDFKERFRPTSVQLQDRDCSKVIEGMTVCASYIFDDTDIRFYDAVVDSVCFNDHTFAKGEEVCTCTFLVFWEQGPNAGTKTSARIEHICLLQSGNGQIDPTLASFLKISRAKLEMASHNSGFISKDDVLVCDAPCHSGTRGSPVEYKSGSTNCKPKFCCSMESKSSKRLVSTTRTLKGQSSIHQEPIGQDIDLGGEPASTENLRETGNCHFILIENLEKDILPSTIVDFIYKQTSISSQAYVFPSLSVESYTRGIIVVDNQEKLKKLSDFLHNPAHVIMSSRGRPWVITEKKSRQGTVEATCEGLMLNYEDQPWNKSVELGVKVKVVIRGTEEYKKGKRLRDLFMDFANHLQRLHERLALEERKILQSSDTA